VIIFEMTKKEFHIILSYKRQYDWGERDSCFIEKVSYFPQMHLWFAFYPDSGEQKGRRIAGKAANLANLR